MKYIQRSIEPYIMKGKQNFKNSGGNSRLFNSRDESPLFFIKYRKSLYNKYVQ